MKIYVPNYYKDFACIAGRCKHSCCIGWEIDIDAQTYALYQNTAGAFGARLRSNIACDGDVPHFVLDRNERCPFLNRDGLCDVILNLGEDALCRICSDHPRYRNYYEGCIELGLGLCCEAAAELILKQTEKVHFVLLEADDAPIVTEPFFAFRARVLACLQDRERAMQARFASVLELVGATLPQKSFAAWCAFYLSLERLDAAWTQRLRAAKENDYMPDALLCEQLACYFIFRHLADGAQDGTMAERIAFAVHATWFICALSTDANDFLEVARMYSAEIEYSEENMQALIAEVGA